MDWIIVILAGLIAIWGFIAIVWISKLYDRIQEINEWRQEDQKEIQDSSDLIDELNKRPAPELLERTEKKYQEVKRKYEDARDSVNDTVRKYHKLEEEKAESDSNFGELSESFKKLSDVAGERSNNIKKLVEKIDILKEAIKRLERDRESLNADCKNMDQQLKDCVRQRIDANHQVVEWQNQHDAVEDELVDLKEKYLKQSSELGGITKNRNWYRRRVAELEGKKSNG